MDTLNALSPVWLGLALAGFILGLFVRPYVVLRGAIALGMLAGLGLLLSNVWGAPRAAWWFGASIAAVAFTFAFTLVGSFAGWCVRKLVGDAPQRPRTREYNSILQD